MDGSSETLPLGEPIIAKFVPTLSAVESRVQNQDFSDAISFAEINSPMLLVDDASTPKKKQACSQEVDFTTGCPCLNSNKGHSITRT